MPKFRAMLDKGEKSMYKSLKLHGSAKRESLSALTKKTLGSGNMRKAVELPADEPDVNEWLAANTVDFFNEISLLYGLVWDDAQRFTKPGEGFPPGFEYRWGGGPGQKPIRVSSVEYVDYVLTWVEDQLDNEDIFVVNAEVEFPEDFKSYIDDIFKRLFRVFAIMYHQHFDVFEEMEAVEHLNTCFKHFMYFSFHFDLIDEKEFGALEGPVQNLKAEYDASAP
ncbi:MOB kinase activator 1A [Hondaea fermentalgiana]|uniref:MOB kinase activator 1A n=1 Tax=Hondaea fermentalgiana TaxID=2315210 RepID=A0A2R5GGD2_9STRA|nr:MOB kinase activator 1A [Hondaea fermentalgiana]|eukprot:GBG26904.1 MOB kinase activator 1A [Hondaea fermentalgiana]